MALSQHKVRLTPGRVWTDSWPRQDDFRGQLQMPCLQATAFAIFLFAAAFALESELEEAMTHYMAHTFGRTKMRNIAAMKGIIATLTTRHPRWG